MVIPCSALSGPDHGPVLSGLIKVKSLGGRGTSSVVDSDVYRAASRYFFPLFNLYAPRPWHHNVCLLC